MQAGGARLEFQRKRLLGGALNGLGVRPLAAGDKREPETG